MLTDSMKRAIQAMVRKWIVVASNYGVTDPDRLEHIILESDLRGNDEALRYTIQEMRRQMS